MPYPNEHARKVEAIRRPMGEWFEENCDPEDGDISICLPDPTGAHYNPEDWTYCLVVHDDGTHEAARFKLGFRYDITKEDV